MTISPPPMRNPAAPTDDVPQGDGGGKRYNMLAHSECLPAAVLAPIRSSHRSGKGTFHPRVLEATSILGIDTSKKTLVSALRATRTRQILCEHSLSNDPEGIRQLLSRTPEDAPWVIEPTGRYSQIAARMATDAGRLVLMAPTRKAKAFLESIQDRAKNDRIDGRGLSLFGLSAPLNPYSLKSETIDTLDQLLSVRKGLVQAKSSLALRQRDLTSLAAQEALAPTIAFLAAQIKALEKEIASRVEAATREPATEKDAGFGASEEILKVHGIGKVTAVAVTARLVAKRFTHPDQFVAYIGLDTIVNDSGDRRGKRRLTKQGDAQLRRLLYLCAQASVRTKGSPFRAQYERELAKGLPKTGALCAVARKMAKLCWSLHRHGSTYDPERVGKPPKRKDDIGENNEPSEST